MQYVNMIGTDYKDHETVTLVRYRNDRGKFTSMNPPIIIEGGKVYVFSNDQANVIGFERFKDSFGPLFVVERNVVNPLLDRKVHAEIKTRVEMKRLDAIEKASEEAAKERLKQTEAIMKEIEKIEKEAEEKIKEAQKKAKSRKSTKKLDESKAVTTSNMPGAVEKKSATTLGGAQTSSGASEDEGKAKVEDNAQSAPGDESATSRAKSKGRKKGRKSKTK